MIWCLHLMRLRSSSSPCRMRQAIPIFVDVLSCGLLYRAYLMTRFFGNLSKLLMVGTRGSICRLDLIAVEAAEGLTFIVG